MSFGVAVGVVMTLASTRGRELTGGGRYSELKREIVSREKIQDNELKTAMIMSLHIVTTYCIVMYRLSFVIVLYFEIEIYSQYYIRCFQYTFVLL